MSELKIENAGQPGLIRTGQSRPADSTGFGKAMKAAIDNVNSLDRDADISVLKMLEGKEEIHKTMIALQKADVSMRMLLSVRNKVIEAYRDIMHMQF
ncbi:MAG: flagellar hook-basal body complex protein FliE [Thermodesulfobacteriota bacterium]|nr:flagellar hook-basal body complex protein FliE [Thermodesulfobacteriota bacterium]